MTRNEIEQLTSLLSRIWGASIELTYHAGKTFRFDGMFYFSYTHLTIEFTQDWSYIGVYQGRTQIRWKSERDVYFSEDEGNAFSIDMWLPFFRSRVFLSRAPLEATAHEKSEWLHEGKKLGLPDDYLITLP